MQVFEYYIWFACFVCLIIGLPTFFSGCGTKIPNTCFAYYETKGTVFGYKITDHICSECTQKDNNKKCTNRIYYQCYNGYAKIHFANNRSCLFEAYDDEKYFTDVQNKLSSYYPVGTTDRLFVNKLDYKECSMNDKGLQGLTYVGITFLSLSGFCLLIGSAFYFFSRLSRRVSFTEITNKDDSNDNTKDVINIENVHAV